MARQVDLLRPGRLPPQRRSVARDAFRGGHPKRVAGLRIHVEDGAAENPGPFHRVFARCAQPENAGAFHNPHIAIAAAAEYSDSSPAPDQRTMTRRWPREEVPWANNSPVPGRGEPKWEGRCAPP